MKTLIVIALVAVFAVFVDCSGLIYDSTLEPTISLTP
jgi:hypothetical protein